MAEDAIAKGTESPHLHGAHPINTRIYPSSQLAPSQPVLVPSQAVAAAAAAASEADLS